MKGTFTKNLWTVGYMKNKRKSMKIGKSTFKIADVVSNKKNFCIKISMVMPTLEHKFIKRFLIRHDNTSVLD